MNDENNVLSPEIKKILKDIEKILKLNDDLKDPTSAGIEESVLDLILEKVFNDNMNNNINNKKCHGCCGYGWIENSFGKIKICPICEGESKSELKEQREIKKENIEYDIQLFPTITISLV